jgi:hypothetical protein
MESGAVRLLQWNRIFSLEQDAMKTPESWMLIICPEPAGKDQFGRAPCYRLRALLKVALRAFWTSMRQANSFKNW